MVAAAYELPSVDRNCDWLAELEQIVSRFDALRSAAQDAVRSVVESLLRDPDRSSAELSQPGALPAATLTRSRLVARLIRGTRARHEAAGARYPDGAGSR
jgi:hypothetical protein